jgi:hypothetical protein
MTHELFSVWKNDGFDPKTPWSVQFPKGILSFKTKKKANKVADGAKRLYDEQGRTAEYAGTESK